MAGASPTRVRLVRKLNGLLFSGYQLAAKPIKATCVHTFRSSQVEVLSRQAGDAWLYKTLAWPTDSIHLAAGGSVLTLAELYEGLLSFPIETDY